MTCEVLALPGDGIGPEVLDAGIDIAKAASAKFNLDLKIKYDLLGGACWDKHQTFCQHKTILHARKAVAVLVGAVGGKKWDDLEIKGLGRSGWTYEIKKRAWSFLWVNACKVLSKAP